MSAIIQMQQKLRSLSKQIEEVTYQLEALKADEHSHQNGDYSLDEIYARAKRSKRPKHRLYQVNPKIKGSYVKLILLAMSNNTEWTKARLILLYELLYSMNYFVPFEELIFIKSRLNDKQMFVALEMIEKYHHNLMLDILLISYLEGSIAEDQANIIASVTALMGISEEDVTFISILARCLIEQDEAAFKKLGSMNTTKWRGFFNSYLPEEWLERSRVYCGTTDTFKWHNPFSLLSDHHQVKNHSYIKRGEILYRTGSSSYDSKIIAKVHGFVQTVSAGDTAYYIISCFDDPNKLSLPFKG